MPAEAMVLYGSEHRPETDAEITGGAIDTHWRPLWYELTWRSLIQVVSSLDTDTRTVTITGRDTIGISTSETISLQGFTAVPGTIEWFRIDKVEASATSTTAQILIIQQVGSLIIHEINPGELGGFRMFLNAAAGGVGFSRYEKLFWKNTDDSDTPTLATVTLTHDAIGKIQFGLEAVINGTQSVADRTIPPSGVTFYNDNDPAPVPGGTLGPGDAIGVWIEMTLNSDEGPFDAFLGLQFCGDFPENNLFGCPAIAVNPCAFNCGPPTITPPPHTVVIPFFLECDHNCPLSQYAALTYDGATTPAGPAVRVTATSDETSFFGLVAVYIPAQRGIALTLYRGESLDGLGTVLETYIALLGIDDIVRIDVDATSPTVYYVKLNGTTVITQTIANIDLNIANPCVGAVPILAVPLGTIPEPPVTDEGEPDVIVVKSAAQNKFSDTVIAADDELKFAMLAGETWTFDLVALVKAGNSAPDISYTMLAPAGSAGKWEDVNLQYSVKDFGTTSGNNLGTVAQPLHIKGTVVCGGTPGDCAFGWAQLATNITNTTVDQYSTLVAFKKP